MNHKLNLCPNYPDSLNERGGCYAKREGNTYIETVRAAREYVQFLENLDSQKRNIRTRINERGTK